MKGDVRLSFHYVQTGTCGASSDNKAVEGKASVCNRLALDSSPNRHTNGDAYTFLRETLNSTLRNTLLGFIRTV